MAEILGGNEEGPGRLAARIEIQDKLGGGLVGHGSTFINADLGGVRAYVSFRVGDEEIFGREVYFHRMSVATWARQVKALIAGDLECEDIYWGIESPEIFMHLRDLGGKGLYELTIGIDVPALSIEGMTGEGPALFLTPDAEDVVQFVEDLLAEIDACLA